MIAIPDFVSGATEHWGIITYREAYLLYEEGISSTVNKQRVAVVIGHELAHMWFGNLSEYKILYCVENRANLIISVPDYLFHYLQ